MIRDFKELSPIYNCLILFVTCEWMSCDNRLCCLCVASMWLPLTLVTQYTVLSNARNVTLFQSHGTVSAGPMSLLLFVLCWNKLLHCVLLPSNHRSLGLFAFSSVNFSRSPLHLIIRSLSRGVARSLSYSLLFSLAVSFPACSLWICQLHALRSAPVISFGILPASMFFFTWIAYNVS